MHVYSLWIFDRHCQAIYHQDWSHLHAAPAQSFTSSIGATLQRAAGGAAAPAAQELRAPGDSLPNVSRSVHAKDAPNEASSALLPFDEEAKLIYGVVFSLRNMVRKLGGPEEIFFSYSTSVYTLSHLQTPSMYTFVLITDPPATKGPLAQGSSSSGALRSVLSDIWRGPWAQVAVQHPTVDPTEREERVAQIPAALPDIPDLFDVPLDADAKEDAAPHEEHEDGGRFTRRRIPQRD
ncbi:Trafficking protein particle complex subunit BET5 [Malassezia cuniculi]|uniref:Trafficking protein particle complex subunit n=1 Tax=Malassezia cuniculi TaxID=948313 RepID=A0AAF0F187_9BASI|nr:Trafficking protein particle complex subunit BET5 [Malassezia cuniculi]